MSAQPEVAHTYPAGMRRFATSLIACAALMVSGLTLAPSASAAPGPAESYLFVVDGSQIKVTPEKGTAARVVITDPSAIRFSDRPYRHVRPIALRALLGEFGWSPTTLKLADTTPNASISIAGERSRVVDIGKAEIRKGRLVLHVISIDGPLQAAKGAGSVFIDNVNPADTFPQTQTADLYIDPTFGTTYTATATLTSPTSATVNVLANGATVLSAVLTPATPTAILLGTLPDGYGIPMVLNIPVYATFDPEGVSVVLSGTIMGPDADDIPLDPVPVSATWGFFFD
jgi:hypothetical protein